MRYQISDYLTKNHILHPNLFPSQSAKPKYSKRYAHSLILDMMSLGIELDRWTETEGGQWLPASYLFALMDSNRELFTNPANYNWPNTYPDWLLTLWDMTKIHSLLFIYPERGELRWDNITGFDPDFLSWGRSHVDYTRSQMKVNDKRKSVEDTTVSVNGLEFFVEYTIESHGCGPTMPSWNYAGDPGEAPEVTIWNITAEVGNGEVVVIHEGKGFTSLVEKIEQEVVQYVAESAVDDWPEDGDY